MGGKTIPYLLAFRIKFYKKLELELACSGRWLNSLSLSLWKKESKLLRKTYLYILTKTINQTNELNYQSRDMFHHQTNSTKINQERRGKTTQPDLMVNCLLCDIQFGVKYISPKKKYSQKNNWGYWTGKKTDQHKYLCNACLMRLHHGSMSDWITNKDKAGDFYQYVYRGQFK